MRTDKQCNICREEFNDDWECSTLCVHDECLKNLRENLTRERKALELACCHVFNAEIPQEFWDKKSDYFRNKARW